MNVIDSKDLERDAQISLRNLRKLDCAGKPVPTFPHPALEPFAEKSRRFLGHRLSHPVSFFALASSVLNAFVPVGS
jgi:hypothetical protein